MIVSSILNAMQGAALPAAPITPKTRPDYVGAWGHLTVAGQNVTVEKAKTLATAYRCGNILSDDIASLPFQVFRQGGRSITRVEPNAALRNTAYLIEIQPNRWMTPFIFKKTIVTWLMYYGNAYIWQPEGSYREFFILDADKTLPGFDQYGNLLFQTTFPNGEKQDIPGAEMLHLMINSTDGLSGKSILTYAKETMGRQLGAKETQNRIQSQGLTATGALYLNGTLNEEARAKVKDAYFAALRGASNTGGVAVFDNSVSKFETISMTPEDAQFLESINATDAEIANFYGMPLHKLNMGKQSYESNEQQNMDYLRTTLNPYLKQWEEAARLKWLPESERGTTYLRFIREALLQTDAKTRSTYLKEQILSGQMTPNEARQINDMSAYEGGDSYYIPANMGRVSADGSLQGGVVTPTPAGDQTEK